MKNKLPIKITIVDDNEELSELIAFNLIQKGFLVNQIFDGNVASSTILEDNPDIVLLDWLLPGITGDTICKELRKNNFGKIIIMLTGQNQAKNKIDAYGFGVSDYLEKPFSIEVLVALLENKIRFLESSEKDLKYSFGNIVHYPNLNLIVKNGKRDVLTNIENKILSFLVNNPDQLISKTLLEENVWGVTYTDNSRTLDMHILRLRKKIENNPKWPQNIITLKGKGLIFKKLPFKEVVNENTKTLKSSNFGNYNKAF